MDGRQDSSRIRRSGDDLEVARGWVQGEVTIVESTKEEEEGL